MSNNFKSWRINQKKNKKEKETFILMKPGIKK
jgi:hypothetical protein